MELKSLDSFHIIGIKVRTINKEKRAGKDIKELWDRFFKDQILEKIPNTVNSNIYSVYTNYQSDHLDWYDCYLGCKVDHLKEIPDGLVGVTIQKSDYKIFTSRGVLPNAVLDTWEMIWKSSHNRPYKADFDVYGEKAKNPNNAVVKTFLSII